MFKFNKNYHRATEIHDVYGGQRQSGISTPSNHPVIFLFMYDNGEQYGYEDGIDKDGVLQYTGQGQLGDMTFTSGNLQIRDHIQNKKTIHIFQKSEDLRGYVNYLGQGEYISHKIIDKPDSNNDIRKTIVFQIEIIVNQDTNSVKEQSNYNVDIKYLENQSLEKLRTAALSRTTNTNLKERVVSIRYRSAAIKIYARKRAKGICEACNQEAPFISENGPYLECHHISRLADNGPDTPENVIALCPNCHRKAHYAKDRKKFGEFLQQKALELELSL